MPGPKIMYDPSRATAAGYYNVTEDKQQPPSPKDKKRLLNLMWWMIYTHEGRGFMHTWRAPQKTDEEVRAAFRSKFTEDFGILDEALLNALTEGHIAAVRWLLANNQMPSTKAQLELDTQEKVYQHYMGFIMWSLWEDSMNVEFSTLW